MSTIAIDNMATYLMMNMTLAERQYLAQKMIAERDEYGLLPNERVAVEDYLSRESPRARRCRRVLYSRGDKATFCE